jgi:hypothetical protein
LAEDIPAAAYSFMEWPPRYAIKTSPRQQPRRVKPQVVRDGGFKTLHVLDEMIAELECRPVGRRRDYRVVVSRKRLGTDQGEVRLFEGYRYFFHITNDSERKGDFEDDPLGKRKNRPE